MRVTRSSAVAGFTLLEVLIAVLIFSFGLLGVAAMILTAMRGNHTAQLHTQATFLAQWVADAMRANPDGVMAGNYNGNAPNGGGANCNAGCTRAQAATRDLQTWGAMVAATLPTGTGNIACNLNPPVRIDGTRAFPAGLCTVTLDWNESTETGKTAASNAPDPASGRKAQQFIWVFNP